MALPGGSKFRIDLGTLRPARRMADGRLVVDAYITRAGIFEYQDENGRVRRELREPEEVFRPDSLSTFQLVPVTNDHPPVGLVDASNARDYMVGSTGDTVVRDDDHVRAPLMVTDAHTIAQMEAGKLEVSCGYLCDLDETPGVHPIYGRYDARQKNIRGNHVAIVDSARAGRTARVRLDGAATQVNSPAQIRRLDMDPDKLKEIIRSLQEQLDSMTKKADEEEARADSATVRADQEHGKVLQLEARVKELEAQIAAGTIAVESETIAREKARADAAEAKVQRFDATIEQRVRSRSKLERQAFVVMGPDFRMDDLGDREIMAAVVKRLDSNADVSASVPDGVITGRFLTLVEGHARSAQSQARVAEMIGSSAQEPRLDAKEQNRQRLRDQWKQPLPNSIRASSAGKDA